MPSTANNKIVKKAIGKSKIKCSKIANGVRLKKIDRLLKFIFDFSLAVPALFLTAPLFLLCGIAVKLDSSGPIIYRRRVMGLNCQQFDAFKFRTMYVNGDEILKAHPVLQAELSQSHKLKHDPRVTRVGRFLRRYSLDELPQLINVLRHDMSLVGPRMISPDEMGKYDQWFSFLLSVKPGITGLWQVSGRSDVSYEDRICLDMYYIQNWSIWLDLLLLFRTIPAVIKGEGAY
jgi:lipopolysaccharide/colanic/teichoic acid biosynthesis glycosyltransferase